MKQIVNTKSGKKMWARERLAAAFVKKGTWAYVPDAAATQEPKPAPEPVPAPEPPPPPSTPEPQPEPEPLPPVMADVRIAIPMSAINAPAEAAEKPENGSDEDSVTDEHGVRISRRTGKPVRQYRRRDMQAEGDEQ